MILYLKFFVCVGVCLLGCVCVGVCVGVCVCVCVCVCLYGGRGLCYCGMSKPTLKGTGHDFSL